MKELDELLQTPDTFATVESIQREGTPAEIAARYQSLVTGFYWKALNLSAVINFGRAGILYCLSQRLPADSTEKLRSIAKAISFNVASFCWPGWGETGIAPTAADVVAGLDCAILNLRLAIELNKPAIAQSKAHWLVAAYALANADFVSAENGFQLALELLPAGDDTSRLLGLLNEGYIALTRMCRDKSNASTAAKFEQIVATLRDHPGDDGKEFASQLAAASRAFK